MTGTLPIRLRASNIDDVRFSRLLGPAVLTSRALSPRTRKKPRATSRSAMDRMPLPCSEPCDGEVAAPTRSGERTVRHGRAGGEIRAAAAVQRLVARLDALAQRPTVEAAQARMLALVQAVAERIDPGNCGGQPSGYARCVLHEDPAGWSLAAIVLRPGQSTPAHDHGGWGGAVTVQGVERDRRFAVGATGVLELVAERDYPPGTGYRFTADDVHQPVGADPDGVTVSLHFLAPTDRGRTQHHHEEHDAARKRKETL